MTRLSPRTVDQLAERYLKLRGEAEAAELELGILRKSLIEEVLAEGATPARAIKTLALAGEKYELRVLQPTEVNVDGYRALQLKDACAKAGVPRLFRKLFRRLTSYVLVDGVHASIDESKLPRRSRARILALFGRAIRVRDLAPQLDVRIFEAEKKRKAS